LEKSAGDMAIVRNPDCLARHHRVVPAKTQAATPALRASRLRGSIFRTDDSDVSRSTAGGIIYSFGRSMSCAERALLRVLRGEGGAAGIRRGTPDAGSERRCLFLGPLAVPSKHFPVLRLVDDVPRRNWRRRLALRVSRARPRFDRQDDHYHRKGHPEDECEPRCSGSHVLLLMPNDIVVRRGGG